MSRRLAYVPVKKPRIPTRNIAIFFEYKYQEAIKLLSSSHLVINSKSGGKIRARQLLDSAPTRDIKRSNCGMAAARTTAINFRVTYIHQQTPSFTTYK